MSLMVQELGKVRGLEGAPKTIIGIVEEVLRAGISPEEVEVVRPRPRDPELIVKGVRVAVWLRIA